MRFLGLYFTAFAFFCTLFVPISIVVYLNITMKILYTLVISILLSVLVCCNIEEWIIELPDNYNGYFIQINDAIIQGYEKPLRFEITKEYLEIIFANDEYFKYPIRKVMSTKKGVIVFCGSSNDEHITEKRFELYWSSNNYLYINEIFRTGHNEEDGKIFHGKYTDNNEIYESN